MVNGKREEEKGKSILWENNLGEEWMPVVPLPDFLLSPISTGDP